MPRPVRLAVRALILQQDRLLLVNAWPRNTSGRVSDLWCAPGGGVEPHASLHENLMREVHEETGLTVQVGDAALVNEFHDPAGNFHQVEIFFRCSVLAGQVDAAWRDPEGVVVERRFFSREALETGAVRFKPDALAAAAWGNGCAYDPLELLQR
jgi:8-oxo-dGTP diphosphatase